MMDREGRSLQAKHKAVGRSAGERALIFCCVHLLTGVGGSCSGSLPTVGSCFI